MWQSSLIRKVIGFLSCRKRSTSFYSVRFRFWLTDGQSRRTRKDRYYLRSRVGANRQLRLIRLLRNGCNWLSDFDFYRTNRFSAPPSSHLQENRMMMMIAKMICAKAPKHIRGIRTTSRTYWFFCGRTSFYSYPIKKEDKSISHHYFPNDSPSLDILLLLCSIHKKWSWLWGIRESGRYVCGTRIYPRRSSERL